MRHALAALLNYAININEFQISNPPSPLSQSLIFQAIDTLAVDLKKHVILPAFGFKPETPGGDYEQNILNQIRIDVMDDGSNKPKARWEEIHEDGNQNESGYALIFYLPKNKLELFIAAERADTPLSQKQIQAIRGWVRLELESLSYEAGAAIRGQANAEKALGLSRFEAELFQALRRKTGATPNPVWYARTGEHTKPAAEDDQTVNCGVDLLWDYLAEISAENNQALIDPNAWQSALADLGKDPLPAIEEKILLKARSLLKPEAQELFNQILNGSDLIRAQYRRAGLLGSLTLARQFPEQALWRFPELTKADIKAFKNYLAKHAETQPYLEDFEKLINQLAQNLAAKQVPALNRSDLDLKNYENHERGNKNNSQVIALSDLALQEKQYTYFVASAEQVGEVQVMGSDHQAYNLPLRLIGTLHAPDLKSAQAQIHNPAGIAYQPYQIKLRLDPAKELPALGIVFKNVVSSLAPNNRIHRLLEEASQPDSSLTLLMHNVQASKKFGAEALREARLLLWEYLYRRLLQIYPSDATLSNEDKQAIAWFNRIGVAALGKTLGARLLDLNEGQGQSLWYDADLAASQQGLTGAVVGLLHRAGLETPAYNRKMLEKLEKLQSFAGSA